MGGNLLPAVVKFLRVARVYDRQHWVPACRHFAHDRLHRVTGAAVFGFERTRACLEVKWRHR